MKVTLDYLTSPALGHKRRCEILKSKLIERGHKVGQFDNPDWLVVDYPKDQFPKRSVCKNRLVMGVLPLEDGDYAWHPLENPRDHTLTGAKWIIIDPKLADYYDSPKKGGILVTCGGADPFHLTEKIIGLIKPECVIIGPNFNRTIGVQENTIVYSSPNNMMELLASYKTIICTWGTTVFESLYLGAKVYPITLSDDHADEAGRLSTMFICKENIDKLPQWIEETAHWNIKRPPIDTFGAMRLCAFMEKNH